VGSLKILLTTKDSRQKSEDEGEKEKKTVCDVKRRRLRKKKRGLSFAEMERWSINQVNGKA